MQNILQTVKIKDNGAPRGYRLINLTDFDSEKHQPFKLSEIIETKSVVVEPPAEPEPEPEEATPEIEVETVDDPLPPIVDEDEHRRTGVEIPADWESAKYVVRRKIASDLAGRSIRAAYEVDEIIKAELERREG